MSKVISISELNQNNSETSAWIAIDGIVYDITKFAKLHPGGHKLLLEHAGKDCSQLFWDLHRGEALTKFGDRLKIGTLDMDEKTKMKVMKMAGQVRAPGTFSTIPYAENPFTQGFKSPYYNDTHVEFRKKLREFYDKEVAPLSATYDNAGKYPSLSLYQKMGKAGILAARIGVACGKYMDEFNLPAGLNSSNFDYFHELIAHEENASFGCPSFADGLGAGLVIGLPPVLQFGTTELKDKVVPEILRGDKRICLAITEPYVGSDVAQLKCTAVLSECKQFYIVNGVKKWITNGAFCDYFTTAVRTGGPGINGISLLLIERSAGLETKQMHTSYGGSAGTSYITYENVKVPVGNLLGRVNQGFKCIMFNFNHERMLIIAAITRCSRLAVEECFKWANQRKVFGKPLIAQAVIRFKLGEMMAEVEGVFSWLENIVYQMNNMSYKEQSKKLAGPIALLKYQCTRMQLSVSDNACQIFGGRAITKTGMGRIIEGFQRSVKYSAILGGSEEVMCDLGVRQAMKFFPMQSRL